MVESRTVTIREAAALTGLTEHALRRRIERKAIASKLQEGRRRIAVAELDRRGLLLEPLSAPADPADRLGTLIDRLTELLGEATMVLNELKVERQQEKSHAA